MIEALAAIEPQAEPEPEPAAEPVEESELEAEPQHGSDLTPAAQADQEIHATEPPVIEPLVAGQAEENEPEIAEPEALPDLPEPVLEEQEGGPVAAAEPQTLETVPSATWGDAEPQLGSEPEATSEPAGAEDEPPAQSQAEPWSEPSATDSQPAPELSSPEPGIATAVSPEPDVTASQPGPDPFAEPPAEPAELSPDDDREIAAATRPPMVPSSPNVTSTLVAWPSASTAAAGNGTQSGSDGFEEATSIIPAWQHSPADSKGTVSLQALPPEQVAQGAGYAALLTFESGPFAGRIVALPSQMVSIGRAPDNDVVVGDPATSGHHGRIEVRAGSFWISDLGSTNGTMVNGEPVIEKQLSDGDLVAVGQNTMRFTLES
jgi:hypothetical protein